MPPEPASEDPQTHLNAVTREFERFLLKGVRPQIEQYLRRVDAAYRGQLLERLLPLEIDWCSREGITLIPLQFYERFPEYHSEVQKVLSRDYQSQLARSWSPPARPQPIAPEPAAPVVPREPPPTALPAQVPTRTEPKPASKRVGKFRILEPLGSGGFGTVYKAEDTVVGRVVALKIPHRLDDEELRRRFVTEVRAAAKLDHPGIVKVFESELEADPFYVAMQYVDGADLGRLIKEQRPTLKQLIQWIRDAARALDHAHQRGVIHRDVKPSNLLISRQGQVYVSDFGLARRVEDNSSLTSTGNILGTPRYMSPEQAAGLNKAVNAASDQYSLGAVLYEVLTGRPPHVGKLPQLLNQIVEQIPPLPRELNPKVPEPLEAICVKATAKNAVHRFRDLGEFAAELDRWLTGRPVTVRLNQSPSLIQQLLQNRAVWMFGTALLLVGAVFAAWIVLGLMSSLRPL